MINHDLISKMNVDELREYVGMPKRIQDRILSIRHGYFDGRNSALFDNPIHNNWGDKPHFNPDYEIGYWLGYDDGVQAERNTHWPQTVEVANG